jgi:hypothetical protein
VLAESRHGIVHLTSFYLAINTMSAAVFTSGNVGDDRSWLGRDDGRLGSCGVLG